MLSISNLQRFPSLISSSGGVIYPIIFTQLQPKVGFGWTTRIIALITTVTLMLPLIVTKMHRSTSEHHGVLDMSAWRELPYLLLAVAVFFGFVGFYVPFCYVQAYSIDKAIMSKELAFYLLPILSAGAFFGRIVSLYK